MSSLAIANHKILTHPLTWLLITLLIFQFCQWLYQRFNRTPVLQPVLTSVFIIVCILKVTGVQYQQYMEGAQWLSLMLGPMIVALAIPLYNNFKTVINWISPMLIAILVGGTATSVFAGYILISFNVDPILVASVWSKSITTAVSMEVAEIIGGTAALAATFVMITGVLGAVIGPSLLKLLKVNHPAIRGTSYGICAHAVGTTKAIEESEQTAAFSALAMGLMAIVQAIAIPLLANYL